MAVSSRELFPELKKLFILPDNCIDVDIRMRLDEAVTVKCRYYPDTNLRDENGDMLAVTKIYTLEEVTE